MANLIEMTNVTDYPYARLAKTLCKADERIYLPPALKQGVPFGYWS
jgi:hypothetical protein